ncbi:MAG: PspC domain-containing protein [Actinobacteria bacterium]|nr:PspC domain-containing protein [Actinomycetota bacterium]
MNDYTSQSRNGSPADTGTPSGAGFGGGTRPTAGAGRPPLRRAYYGRMLAGVAAGIADYLGVDVTLIRVAFVVATLLGGAGVPAYLACLLLIPEEGSDVSLANDLLDSIQSR